MKGLVNTWESPLRNPLRLSADVFRGLFAVRELVWILFLRDLKAQFRESYLGYLWLIAPPLVTMGVWTFLNSQKIIRVETEIPYAVFVLIGTTIWTSFSATLLAPLSSFNLGKAVFMKQKVPPEAFVLAGFFRAVFDFGIRLLLLIPVFFIFKIVPPSSVVLFPLAMFTVLSFAVAIGLLLIPIGGLYGDVSNAITTFVNIFMYTAPIIFPVPAAGMLATIMKYNPLTPLVMFCRETLTDGGFASMPVALMWLGGSLFFIFIALVILRIAMPHLVARMGM